MNPSKPPPQPGLAATAALGGAALEKPDVASADSPPGLRSLETAADLTALDVLKQLGLAWLGTKPDWSLVPVCAPTLELLELCKFEVFPMSNGLYCAFRSVCRCGIGS